MTEASEKWTSISGDSGGRSRAFVRGQCPSKISALRLQPEGSDCSPLPFRKPSFLVWWALILLSSQIARLSFPAALQEHRAPRFGARAAVLCTLLVRRNILNGWNIQGIVASPRERPDVRLGRQPFDVSARGCPGTVFVF